MNKNNLHTADNALNSLQNNVSEYPEGPKMTFTFVNDVINPSPPPKKKTQLKITRMSQRLHYMMLVYIYSYLW
jgi:hypothetical protein